MGLFKKKKNVDDFNATDIILQNKIEINTITGKCRVNKYGNGKLNKKNEKIFDINDIIDYEFDYIKMKDKASSPVIKFKIKDFDTPIIKVKVDDYIGIKPKEYDINGLMFSNYITLGERAVARLDMLLSN